MTDPTGRSPTGLTFTEVDPDELGEPYVPACQCDNKTEFDLTVSEGTVLLKHTTCGEWIDLDDYGWWYEAIELQEPVRVTADWVIENSMEGPQPSYILLTPTDGEPSLEAQDE